MKDRLYSETDDACAICGTRGVNILTVHHIDGDRANSAYDNQIVLCHNCHCQHNQDKGLSREQIEDRKRHLIQKTVTTYGLNAMKIAARKGSVPGMPFLLYHLVDLGYMKKEEDAGMQLGTQDAISLFTITPEGSRLLRKWFS